MSESKSEFVDIKALRVGLFIELEMGWMAHPFPKGSFKITSEKQIEVIRGLGLERVRYDPDKSDSVTDSIVACVLAPNPVYAATDQPELLAARQHRGELLSAQQRDLLRCERRFVAAIQQYKLTLERLDTDPGAALQSSLAVVTSLVDEILQVGELAIRLLSEGMGDKVGMHPVNVAILSLLLGKSLGLQQSALCDLGLAAFLHDMGKSRLPDRVRWLDENFSHAELMMHQDHVVQGVSLGQRMALSGAALQAIAEHHQFVDGSGYPAPVKSLSFAGKILALVNHYENLCNPPRAAAAMTPHEALAFIFAQFKTRFDGPALAGFIRMMGVYPPGSVVQLVDGRYALVMSVNSARPLKPSVIVHEPGVPKDQALILELEQEPGLAIRRSLKPLSLPIAAMEYLSPRQRICYSFERSAPLVPPEEAP